MKNLIINISVGICTILMGIIGTLIVCNMKQINFKLEPKVVISEKKEETIKEIVKNPTEDMIVINKFELPVDSKFMTNISSEQGLRDKITLNNGGTAGRYYHNAIDIVIPEGTRVNATKNGTVINVYPSYYNGGANYKGHPTYGGLVEIQHDDGTKTLYAHLSLTLVKEGDTVISGQKIGESGGVAGKRGSGLSTGPHLHYSIILDLNTFSSI